MQNQLNGHTYERITAGEIRPGDIICYANTTPATVTRIEQRDTNMGPSVVLHWDDSGQPLALRANATVYRILDDRPEQAEPQRGPGRPEVGPATNIRLGVERTARIDATRHASQSRADAIRNLIDSALDVTTPPYSTAYGIGMAHGARTGLRIIDECDRAEIAAYVRGDKMWPDNDLTQGSRYTYIDLARDMGREITWGDVNFNAGHSDPWLETVADAYTQGYITGQRTIVEAAHAVSTQPVERA